MKRLHLLCFLLAIFSLSATAQAPAQTALPEPKSSMEWFQRASDRMNLRQPDSAPFHMRVTFHAFPGEELLGLKEKPEILSGDGVYEETWLGLHQWRREVKLGSYHAVETDFNGVRKMQAISEYEPGRVLTLLNALLIPIPRSLSSREFRHEGGSGWKIDHVAVGDLSLVRISKSFGGQRADFTTAYYLLPSGMLALRNERGLVTAWENVVHFEGKAVPKHLSIKAVDRDLLTADISIEAAGPVNPATFDLPGGPAEPGTTLRPLQGYEIRVPDLSGSYMWVQPGLAGPVPAYSFQSVLDRQGKYREVELIFAQNQEHARKLFVLLRQDRHKPATIDGTVCEFVMSWSSM